MKIKKISFRNMISNESMVEISFLEKYYEENSERYFKNSITKKQRSQKYNEGILKVISLMGKNASYKTSTLLSVDKILDFVVNFKKNALAREENLVDFNTALEWYEENNGIPIYEDEISFSKIIKKYVESINKNKDDNNIRDSYIKYFYSKNSFNKSLPIEFEIIFYNHEKNIEEKFNGKILYENEKLIQSFKLNDEPVNIFKDENIKNFKHDFASFEYYNINGRIRYSKKQNLFLHLAVEYLYFEKFKKNQKKLMDFFKVLDPSISGILIKEFPISNKKNRKRIHIHKVIREYGNYKEDITLDQFSSGTKVFLTYLYFILKNDFIIIDEIEQSLHLKLVEILLDISRENNKQIIFSTHSPLVIQKMVKNFELYLLETNSKNYLKIFKIKSLYRKNDNFINKYLMDVVSSAPDIDLDFIRMEMYD